MTVLEQPASARAISVVMLPLALAAFLLVQLGSTVKDFNADSNYMVLLVDDLIRGGAVSDWYLAPHIYLFPEAPLTLAILALHAFGVPPYTGAVAVYGAAYIAIGSLLWRRWSDDSLTRSAVWAGVILSLVYAGLYVFPSRENFLVHLLLPGMHGGSMMMAGVGALVACELIDTPTWSRKQWLLLAGYAVAVALTVFSDFIFIVWGLLPFIPVLLSQKRRLPMRRLLTIVGVIFAAVVVGYLFSLLVGALVSERYFFSSVVQDWIPSLRAAGAYFWAAATFAQVVPGIVFYSNIVLWIAAVRAFMRERSMPGQSRRNPLLIFVGAASAFSIVITVAPGLYRFDALRMFTPYLFWGSFTFFSLVPSLTRRYATPVLAIFLMAALAIGGWLYSRSGPLRADLMADCLSARGLSTGAASFWEALPIMVATDRKIHVVSLSPYWADKAPPFEWMFKRQWLTHRALDGAPAMVQFVIVGFGGPSKATLINVFGVPSSQIACAGRTVLLFDPPKPLPWSAN
jgi:hypothetical protein